MSIELKTKKILIVDDLPQMRTYLRSMLSSLGASSIDMAFNGEEAIRKISEGEYDIILCDFYLGEGKDGQQVLEEAKFRGYIRFSTVFMMITAQSTSEIVAGTAEYLPDDYLTKPFTGDTLKMRLERLVEKKSVFQKVDEAVHRGNYAKAIQICDAFIPMNSKYTLEFMKVKANLCIQSGNYQEAQKVYENILGLRQIPWAKLGLAKVLFFMKEYNKARSMLEKIIDENASYIEAYDWLAKIYQEQGNLEMAQQMLKTASHLSPRAIKRQKLLGEISHIRGDLDVAEKAYRMTVKLGKYSCFKEPSDYTGLSKVMLDKGDPREALRALKEAKGQFGHDNSANFQTKIVEAIIHKKLGHPEDAAAAYKEASALYDSLSSQVPPSAVLDMAQACFEFNDQDRAKKLVVNLVQNNHDDEKILRRATAFLENNNVGKEGKEIVESAARQIIHLNNKGVTLAKEGRLEEAVKLFENAADSLPSNKVISMNAIQSMLQFMQKNGKVDYYLTRVKQYLDRVGEIDPTNPKYIKLADFYQRLLRS